MRPLAVFLLEEGATEVKINKPGEVWVDIGPRRRRFEASELTLERLVSLVNAVATYTDQSIGSMTPILTAMLPDFERIQIVMPPAVEPGSISITIRKPGGTVKSIQEYEQEGAFNRYVWGRSRQLDVRREDLSRNERMLVEHLESRRLSEFFKLAIKAKKNIAVVGDTGSGKTTLMKSLCQWIPMFERLITIEDVRELFLSQPDRVHLLYSKGGQGMARVTPSDLIASCMRMKPDRVLLAELRGGEAFDFLKLLTTGHSGSLTSFHAESCAIAKERYVLMCKEHEQATIYDADALKKLIELTIDIIVHVVAEPVYEDGYDSGDAVRIDRYVTEVHYDPIAKLAARFGDATLYRAG